MSKESSVQTNEACSRSRRDPTSHLYQKRRTRGEGLKQRTLKPDREQRRRGVTMTIRLTNLINLVSAVMRCTNSVQYMLTIIAPVPYNRPYAEHEQSSPLAAYA
jgi:hypothetical protein